jgi:hypothetical protein
MGSRNSRTTEGAKGTATGAFATSRRMRCRYFVPISRRLAVVVNGHYSGDEICRTQPLTVFAGRLGSYWIRTLAARWRPGILSIATADEIAKQGRLSNAEQA